jgi:hypothetical protein
MKKFTIIAIFLTLVSFGCKKEKTPTPITPAPASSYTAADSAISGDWILNVTESYVNGSLVYSTPHSDPANCHLNLQLIESITPGGWKKCIYGLNCTNVALEWRLNTGMIEIHTDLYTILSQSSNSLVLQNGSPATSAIRFHFTK